MRIIRVSLIVVVILIFGFTITLFYNMDHQTALKRDLIASRFALSEKNIDIKIFEIYSYESIDICYAKVNISNHYTIKESSHYCLFYIEKTGLHHKILKKRMNEDMFKDFDLYNGIGVVIVDSHYKPKVIHLDYYDYTNKGNEKLEITDQNVYTFNANVKGHIFEVFIVPDMNYDVVFHAKGYPQKLTIEFEDSSDDEVKYFGRAWLE